MQNEAPSAQSLSAPQKPEQQSPLFTQLLPAVRQLSFNEVQVLSAPHAPLQHASFPVHASPSETHCVLEHFPETQLSEQQSVPPAQSPPEGAHVVIADVHPVFGSQAPEQHSLPAWQAKPAAWHITVEPVEPAAAPELSLPAVDALAPLVPLVPPASPSFELLPPQPVQIAQLTSASRVTVLAKRMLNPPEANSARTRAGCLLRGQWRRTAGLMIAGGLLWPTQFKSRRCDGWRRLITCRRGELISPVRLSVCRSRACRQRERGASQHGCGADRIAQ